MVYFAPDGQSLSAARPVVWATVGVERDRLRCDGQARLDRPWTWRLLFALHRVRFDGADVAFVPFLLVPVRVFETFLLMANHPEVAAYGVEA